MDYIKRIQLDFCTVSLRSDGIIENRFERNTQYEIDVKVLEDINNAINSLFGTEKRAVLSVSGLYGTMTSEARSVDVSQSENKTIALAIILESLSQRLIAKFYFKLKKISYPVKYFRYEKDAVTWLEQQVNLSKK